MATRGSEPLAGVQVVVTRPETGDGPLGRRLEQLGARVHRWSVVRFEAPVDVAPLDEALGRLCDFDAIVFTSPRAVTAVSERVAAPPGGPRIAAIGEATRAALAAAGWRVDVMPQAARSEVLVHALGASDWSGRRVLFPASEIARDEIPRGLRAAGATVERVTAYRTVPAPDLDAEELLGALDADAPTIVTFASPSAVSALAELLGSIGFRRLLTDGVAVAIGPTTAEALRARGVTPRVATASTLAGLAEAAVGAACYGKEG